VIISHFSSSKNTIDSLKILKHNIKERRSMGHVNAIHVDNKIDVGADKRGSNFGLILSNN